MEARQVPHYERPCARQVLERDQERPLDGQLVEVARVDPRCALQDVPESVHEQELDDDADHADRPGPSPDVLELPG